MHFPSWKRLVDEYARRMGALYSGNLVELLANPQRVWTPQFQARVDRVAEMMAVEVAHANEKSWRAAAMKSTRARRIYEALQEEIADRGLLNELRKIARRNAKLISSIPSDVAEKITEHALELQQRGARPDVIAQEIQRMAPKLARSRIELIARTEVSRAETDLTRGRSESIGIEWYVWETSRDSRVRDSHRNMGGVLVAWNNPPSPEALIGEKSTLGRYHAGQAPNCRCPSLPLTSLDEVRWPARVYYSNEIKRMTRKAFAQLAGLREAA